MTGFMTPSDREQRLPAWIRSVLAALRERVLNLEGEVRSLTGENDRLRTAVGEKAADDSCDTYLVQEDSGACLPLGDGVTIRFGSWVRDLHVRFDVSWSAATGELMVESLAGDLVIAPVSTSFMAVRPDRV